MIVLFKCNHEVLPLSYYLFNIDDNGRHNVTNETGYVGQNPTASPTSSLT